MPVLFSMPTTTLPPQDFEGSSHVVQPTDGTLLIVQGTVSSPDVNDATQQLEYGVKVQDPNTLAWTKDSWSVWNGGGLNKQGQPVQPHSTFDLTHLYGQTIRLYGIISKQITMSFELDTQ